MNTGYIDTIYNVSRTPFTSYPLKLADEISKRCSLITSSSLLDLGCGRGEMSSAFDQLGFSVTSCDKESVISRFFNNINFAQVDFETSVLPLLTTVLMLSSVSLLLSICMIR